MRTSACCLVSMLLAVTLLPGCGAALAMLKGPIVDKCKDSRLEGCDGMAEGAITYLGGDHAEGRRQIAAGAAKNAPKDVAIFAVSLRTVASLPGAGDYKADLEEIAGILQGAPSVAAASPTRSQRDLDRSPSTTTSSAATSAAHVRAGTASFRGAKACTTVLGASSCARGVQGPATVTMLFTPGGCPADLVAYAGDADDPSWWMLLPSSSSVSLTRIALPVGEDSALHFAARGDANDPRCSVVWTADAATGAAFSARFPEGTLER